MNPPYSSYTQSNLKLFLDMAPSFSSDVTRALRGFFLEGSVNISLRFLERVTKGFRVELRQLETDMN